MQDNLIADITKAVDELAKLPEVEAGQIATLTQQVGKAFSVKPDEVALLILAHNDKFLRFVVPEKLQKVGDIPMTSTNSLAVRTAREKRPEVINNFATARHPTVFEAVPLGQQRGEPIQKIMSAPITAEGKPIGVMQLSRKGKTVTAAGPDFTPKDLSDLVAVANLVGRCLKKYTVT
jgi:GAF domain-containing protein